MRGKLIRYTGIITGSIVVLVVSFYATLVVLKLWEQQNDILQTVVQKNNAFRLEITNPISSDPAKARVTDGVSFADASILPKDPTSTIRVHIRAYLSSDQLGTAVLAAFLDSQEGPVQVFTRALPSRNVEEAIEVFDIPANIASKIELHIRIGPADERPIYLNFNRAGASLISVTTIVEIRRT